MDSRRAFRPAFWWLLLALASSGCDQTTSAPERTKATPQRVSRSPEKLLQRVVDAYRSATAYSDQGRVTVSYREGAEIHEETADLAVSFRRPDRLRLAAYQVTLVADGARLRATIADEATGNLDGQVLDKPAQASLSLDAVYDDPLLRQMLEGGAAGYPVQLELLLGKTPLKDLLGKKTIRRLLSDGVIDDHPCHRLRAETERGAYILWIDPSSLVVRRLEYPPEALAGRFPAGQPPRDLRLTVDFHEASLRREAVNEKDFRLSMPDGARPVAQFVVPPEPLPTTLFGKPVGDVSFSNLAGEIVGTDELVEKVAVLAWYNHDAACQATLRRLAAIVAQFSDDDRIAFYAVCQEPSSRSDEEIRQHAEAWGIGLPILRDREAAGRDRLGIDELPALIVLDADSVLHVFQERDNPYLEEELPVVLRELLAGKNLAEMILDDDRRQRAAYLARISEAPIEEVTAAAPAFRQPAHFSLKEVWRNESIAAPGNLLPPDKSRLLVLSEGRSVAEVDVVSGETTKTYSLDLQEGQSVTILRAGQPSSFAAWSLLGRQVSLYSGEWKRLAAYPATDEPHLGICDIQLFDLDRDGEVEGYVAFLGLAGMHSIDLKGETRWSNRASSSVLALVNVAGDEEATAPILAVTERGALLPVDAEGRHGQEIIVNGYPMAGLHRSADNEYLGLAVVADEKLAAIGFDRSWAAAWKYELPGGKHRSDLQFVASGELLDGSRQWLIVDSEGEFHVLSYQGELLDRFHLGIVPAGIAIGVDGTLFVSTPTGVQAWRLAK